MRYALVDGQRVEARPSLEGVCPSCKAPAIPRCGTMRVRHWAHRGKRTCDAWWEPITEWHLGWQSRFPKDWREMIRRAPDGEKHIADVRTPHGLVIEFQHSFLKPQERLSREAFYGNMVWVVDGMRRKHDRKRFFDAIIHWQRLKNRVFVTQFVEEGLPNEWLSSSAPVYFDFGDAPEPENPIKYDVPVLWCLLPRRAMGDAVIVAVPKSAFIKACRTGTEVFDADKLMRAIEQHFRRRRSVAYGSHPIRRRQSVTDVAYGPRPRWWRKKPNYRL